MLYKAKRLIKEYGGRKVLDIEELSIESGKVYTLIGPNGAGKSTLLSLFSFLETPTSGSIHFNNCFVGPDFKGLQQLRKKVVLVDQSPVMFSGTVWKNVDYGLKIRKINKYERKARVENALNLVGMMEFAKSNAQRLSGGETKRVALARALAVNPEVLLLDEPTANVDVENQQIIIEIIEKINRQQKTSIIFSTHQLAEAQELADCTIQLKNGMLGSWQRQNSFYGEVIRLDGNILVCRLDGSAIELTLDNSHAFELGESLLLNFSPRAITFVDDTVRGSTNCISAHVSSIVRKDDEVTVLVNEPLDIKVVLPYHVFVDKNISLVDPVSLRIPPAAITVRKIS